MREEQTILADFLNHGILPFVGREDLIETIEATVAGTIEATSLRSLLVIGEAGIGKSKLVEEVIQRSEYRRTDREKEVIIHARLRPASSTSPVTLLAHALQNSHSARPLLRRKLSATIEEVVESLRRLCQLRPTLLILEDIHLLEDDTLQDFAGILSALSDDPITLLCSTRPGNEAPSALLEASLVERIQLKGLAEEDVALMSGQLFGERGDNELVKVLTKTTLGNPLAIRGALRSALRQDAIQRDGTGRWSADVRFGEIIRRGAESISDGFAASLFNGERSAAGQLACLGEIFSYEAAEILLGDQVERMLRPLTFKGILVRSSTTAAPLPGTSHSQKPLIAFTHTLVHHTLATEAAVPTKALLEVLLHDIPLYAITPFETLAISNTDSAQLVIPQLPQLIDRAISIAEELDSTSEWTLALRLIDGMLNLLRASGAEENQVIQGELDLLDAYLLVSRELHGKDFDRRLHIYRTSAALFTDMASRAHLLKALVHEYRRKVYTNHASEEPDELEQNIIELIEAHPDLQRTEGYVRFLEWKTERAALRGDWNTQDEIERTLESLAENPEFPDHLREDLYRQLRTNFLSLMRTPEEYRKRICRIKQADEAQNHRGLSETSWLLQKARFYGIAGDFKRQAALYVEAESLARKRGQSDVAQSLSESIIKCQVALGMSLEEAETVLLQINALHSPESGRPADPIVVNNLTAIALLSGKAQQAIDFYDHYFPTIKANPTTLPSLLALWREDPAKGWSEAEQNTTLKRIFYPVLHLLRSEDDEDDRKQIRDWIEEVMEAEPIAMRHAMSLEIVLRLLKLSNDRIPEAKRLLRMGTRKALAWSAERELWTFMQATLEHYGDILSLAEQAKVAQRIAMIQQERASLVENRSGEKNELYLKMLGTIEGRRSEGGEICRPRGERLKTLLGVMTANELLPRPLEREEFLSLASGQQGTSRQARDVVNKTVSRLRESLGNSAYILTDQEIPRLNREIVEVDLLRVKAKLRSVEQSLRQHNLVKGVADIRECLQLWGGEVPFPTLYDEFFESLRDEFEMEIRELTLFVAAELLRLEDFNGAEELLRLLIKYLPEDREPVEMLVTVLEMSGKKTEAIRIRSQGVLEMI